MLASNRGRGARGHIKLVLLCGLVLCSAATAGLDGNLASVESDARFVGASSVASPLAGATLYTQQLSGGVTLRQYVSPAGKVFAVGWEGPVLPDFRRLLGEHYTRYSEALRQQNRQVHIQRSDLVLEAGGMMRAFSGRAYLPTQLPPTLSGADIR